MEEVRATHIQNRQTARKRERERKDWGEKRGENFFCGSVVLSVDIQKKVGLLFWYHSGLVGWLGSIGPRHQQHQEYPRCVFFFVSPLLTELSLFQYLPDSRAGRYRVHSFPHARLHTHYRTPTVCVQCGGRGGERKRRKKMENAAAAPFFRPHLQNSKALGNCYLV